jgi:hypothetical protein
MRLPPSGASRWATRVGCTVALHCCPAIRVTIGKAVAIATKAADPATIRPNEMATDSNEQDKERERESEQISIRETAEKLQRILLDLCSDREQVNEREGERRRATDWCG